MSRGATLKSVAASLSAGFYLPAAGPPPATGRRKPTTESDKDDLSAPNVPTTPAWARA